MTEAREAMTWPVDAEWFEARMHRPHKYAENCNPKYPGTCWGCGKKKDDPIHAVIVEADTAAIERSNA